MGNGRPSRWTRRSATQRRRAAPRLALLRLECIYYQHDSIARPLHTAERLRALFGGFGSGFTHPAASGVTKAPPSKSAPGAASMRSMVINEPAS